MIYVKRSWNWKVLKYFMLNDFKVIYAKSNGNESSSRSTKGKMKSLYDSVLYYFLKYKLKSKL